MNTCNINDIDKVLLVIDKSIKWAEEYNVSAFPYETFRKSRRELKRMRYALSENCSAAAYGESQVGKSYLMSSLLSSQSSQFRISDGTGGSYSFVDDLNPSGGNTSKEESTGVITRFTINCTNEKMRQFVKIKTLSVVDIVLLLADSYYKDVKIDTNSVLDKNTINDSLSAFSNNSIDKSYKQSYLEEDDIYDIQKYFEDIIGNSAVNVIKSDFCVKIAPVIKYYKPEKWGSIFALLWNNNSVITGVFNQIIAEYKKLRFEEEIYVPFDAVLRDKGTILKVKWLDYVSDSSATMEGALQYSDIYDKDGNLLAPNFKKAFLSALTAELTFVVPKEEVADKPFLNEMDLLDFPGARRRESVHEADIEKEMANMLRRGKVSYLFNKYSRTLRINSVLFCQHQDMSGQSEIGETLNEWISNSIGNTPEERANYINSTNKISPFFIIATKFNTDLKWTNEKKGVSRLEDRWKTRFEQTLSNETIKPKTYKWFENWVSPELGFKSKAFQSIYLLRDFFWSRDQQVFTGYKENSAFDEKEHIENDYPDYRKDLKESFVNFLFVKEHFADPSKSWDDAATPNNDGSKAIIKDLNKIAGSINHAREEKYYRDLQRIKDDLYQKLNEYFVPDDEEEKREVTMRIIGAMRLDLTLLFGTNPSAIGMILDALMIPVVKIRTEVHNVIIRHTDAPQDRTPINILRTSAKILTTDDRDTCIEKLCDHFKCDYEALSEVLRRNGLEIDNVVNGEDNILTTMQDVVVKHIYDLWINHLNDAIRLYENSIRYSDKIVAMYATLYDKLKLRHRLSEIVLHYMQTFPEKLQPNVIADATSLVLNNFIADVGWSLMSEKDKNKVRSNASELGVDIENENTTVNAAMPLTDTLKAFEQSTSLVSKPDLNSNDVEILRKLPWWDNYKKWENHVIMGLLMNNDFLQCNPKQNGALRNLLEMME